MMTAKKLCSKCGKTKSVKKFSKDKYSQSGYTSQCLDCRNANNKTEEHREAQKGYLAKYHKSEKGKQTRKRYRKTEKAQDTDRKYEQLDRVKARRKQYMQSEAGKEATKRYQQSDKGKKSANHFNKSNKGKEGIRRRSALRRAQKYQSGGSYTSAEWYKLCEFYSFRCLRCNKKFPIEKLEVDHVKPVSKGGSSFIWNIQPLCGKCNRRKHNKEIDYRETLPD